jgi:transposase
VQLGLASGEAHDNALCAALLSELQPQALLLAIKQCRRVAMRYDKLAANYLTFVKLA